MDTTNTSGVEPLEGKTTIDDKMFFEPERLCYASAAQIARDIAATVKPLIDKHRVVVVGTDLLVDFANLEAVSLTLRTLEQDYLAVAAAGQSLLHERARMAAAAAGGLETALASVAEAGSLIAAATGATFLTPITAGVSAAIGLISLFREDVEFHGIKTVVDPLAFELVLADQLRESGAAAVYVPDLLVVTQNVNADSLRARIQAVHTAKARAFTLVGPLISELVARDAELDDASRRGEQARVDTLTAVVAQLRKELEPVSEPLARTDERLSQLEAAWQTPDAVTGMTGLARLLRAEAIRGMGATLVHARVVSSGGHHRVSRHLLRMMFLGDGLSFSGGAVVRWAVLGTDGRVLGAGLNSARRSEK